MAPFSLNFLAGSRSVPALLCAVTSVRSSCPALCRRQVRHDALPPLMPGWSWKALACFFLMARIASKPLTGRTPWRRRPALRRSASGTHGTIFGFLSWRNGKGRIRLLAAAQAGMPEGLRLAKCLLVMRSRESRGRHRLAGPIGSRSGNHATGFAVCRSTRLRADVP